MIVKTKSLKTINIQYCTVFSISPPPRVCTYLELRPTLLTTGNKKVKTHMNNYFMHKNNKDTILRDGDGEAFFFFCFKKDPKFFKSIHLILRLFYFP